MTTEAAAESAAATAETAAVIESAVKGRPLPDQGAGIQSAKPARRRPSPRRGVTAEEPVAQTPPAVTAGSNAAEAALSASRNESSPAQVEGEAEGDETALSGEPGRGHRRRGRRGRGTRSGGTAASGEGGSPEGTAPPPVELAEFEPLPPPTKRKAPRVIPGVRTPRPAPELESASDWALGRPAAPVDPPAPLDGDPSAASGPRRRSRRGRRGRGGASGNGGVEAAEPMVPSVNVAPEEPQIQPQQRPVPPPQRDDRGRSQLSTFESLVARQNVVLDSLLARISNFSSIERALAGIERRLSSQGFGTTTAGGAAPRVGVFVDVPNIIYAADRIGVTIDFGKLLHLLTRGRELVRASAYAPISDDPQQRLATQKFVQPFVHGGYRIVTKPLKRFSDGTMKGNFDVELAMDVLIMSERLDVVSLVSGDGDFSRLVDIVGSKGVRVEVAAFGASTSAELRAICDDYIDLQTRLDEIS